MNIVLAHDSLPFTISLTVMLLIALLEGVSTVLGLGLSELLENVLPDMELDVNMEPGELETPSGFSRILSWLRIGQVPILVLMIVFLTLFGLIGLGLQKSMASTFGAPLPWPVAIIATLLPVLPMVRFCGGIVARYFPRDETEAVSEATFIGRVAVITLGEARTGRPAEARLRDQFGQTHYVQVEPDREETFFRKGDQVLLVSRFGNVFKGIINTNPSLTDGY